MLYHLHNNFARIVIFHFIVFCFILKFYFFLFRDFGIFSRVIYCVIRLFQALMKLYVECRIQILIVINVFFLVMIFLRCSYYLLFVFVMHVMF